VTENVAYSMGRTAMYWLTSALTSMNVTWVVGVGRTGYEKCRHKQQVMTEAALSYRTVSCGSKNTDVE